MRKQSPLLGTAMRPTPYRSGDGVAAIGLAASTPPSPPAIDVKKAPAHCHRRQDAPLAVGRLKVPRRIVGIASREIPRSVDNDGHGTPGRR